jgi:hypothetical protein
MITLDVVLSEFIGFSSFVGNKLLKKHLKFHGWSYNHTDGIEHHFSKD